MDASHDDQDSGEDEQKFVDDRHGSGDVARNDGDDDQNRGHTLHCNPLCIVMPVTVDGVHERNSGKAALRLLCRWSDTRSVPAKATV